MSSKKPVNFSKLLSEVEDIISWFESEELDIEIALVKYQRGQQIISELENFLAHAKNTVEHVDLTSSTHSKKSAKASK